MNESWILNNGSEVWLANCDLKGVECPATNCWLYEDDIENAVKFQCITVALQRKVKRSPISIQHDIRTDPFPLDTAAGFLVSICLTLGQMDQSEPPRKVSFTLTTCKDGGYGQQPVADPIAPPGAVIGLLLTCCRRCCHCRQLYASPSSLSLLLRTLKRSPQMYS
uniref:Uncharacterized protein n=1 Tax=Trichuris muris TaxID=70415 RepID=A0A5S6QML7_TRIMR